MHTHFSLFEGETNAFHDPDDEYQMSATGKAFLAGVLTPRPGDHRGVLPVRELATSDW